MQERFINLTTSLNDAPQNSGEPRALQDWLSGCARRLTGYNDVPDHCRGMTIEFSDGTAVTVVTQTQPHRMELHRGKCRDRARLHWLDIAAHTKAMRNHIEALHEMPKLGTNQPQAQRLQ